MSSHFNANQYDDAFNSKRLQNWQIPKTFQEHPSQYEGFTQIIANDRGHILPGVARSNVSPWGVFVGTWDMPRKISRNKSMTHSNCMLEKKDADPLAKVQGSSNKASPMEHPSNNLLQGSSPDKVSPMEHRPTNPSPNTAGSPPPPKTTTPAKDDKCIVQDDVC